MIKKYYEFINESLEIILESNVVYSSNFKKVLSKINSSLSKSILDIENKDYDVQSNFFDIDLLSKNNNKVTFIPDRKAKEILGDTKEIFRYNRTEGGWLKHKYSNQNLFDKLGYVFTTLEPYKPNSTDLGELVNKVTSDQSGKTYAWIKFKNAEGTEVGEGVYNMDRLVLDNQKFKDVWVKSRQEINVGRAIGALLRSAKISEYTNRDIELFVNSFKSIIDKMNDKFAYFDVVSGSDIAYWYNYKNYYERRGTLGGSCMSEVPNNWLEIYTDNPNNVNLVIFKSQDDDSKIIGRALLWTLPDGKKFMDRVYTINDSDVNLFKEYAKENKWYSKYYNNSSETNKSIGPDGEVTTLDMIITLNKIKYNHYPYLDTFKHFCEEKGTISNMPQSRSSCVFLEDTSGGYISDSCEMCDGSGRASCQECDGRGEIECHHCNGDGEMECDECNGKGDVECDECDGSGMVDDEKCEKCDGKGEIECGECNGSGETKCENCGGDGEIECGECGGAGEIDCPECS